MVLLLLLNTGLSFSPVVNVFHFLTYSGIVLSVLLCWYITVLGKVFSKVLPSYLALQGGNLMVANIDAGKDHFLGPAAHRYREG